MIAQVLVGVDLRRCSGCACRSGVLLHDRLRAGDRDRERRQELVEQLLNQDAVTRIQARDEVVDRGLLDDNVPAGELRALGRSDAAPAEPAAVIGCPAVIGRPVYR